MNHSQAHERLPDLLADRDNPELVAHVSGCHDCQQQLFHLTRIDRILRTAGRRHRRSPRVRLLGAAGAAAAVAAVIVAALTIHLPRDPASTTAFTIHTADGRTLGRAIVRRQDRVTDRVVLIARGMPAVHGDQYLLWTETGDGSTRIPVGRFMVDKSGACRAAFSLPAATHWRGFIVTTVDNAALVVAST